MASEKLRGIIIKTFDYKEKDRLVYIYTEEFGKITAIAKNVRTKTSKTASILQPLTLCDFVLFKGKSMYILNEVSMVNSFNDLKMDFELLTYGLYYLELCDISQGDGEYNKEYFMDLIKALYFLNTNTLDVNLLSRFFEVKTLERSGNYPDVSYLETVLSGEAKGFLKFLLSNELEKINVIKVSGNAIEEVAKVTKELIRESYHRIPKSLSILET